MSENRHYKPDAEASVDSTHDSSVERQEDTANQDFVQGLEEAEAQKSAGLAKEPSATNRYLQKLLDESPEEINVRWGRRQVKKADDKELISHLVDFQTDLNNLLAWKEDLRLLTVSYMVPGPYYESWTKEANLFFRRLVIINKRLKTQKKLKRA